MKLWTARNGCPRPAEPEVTLLEDCDPGDGTRARRERYAGPAEVVLYAIEGGGHTWPGGRQYAPAFIVGRTTRDIDGCALIWAFFKAHARERTF